MAAEDAAVVARDIRIEGSSLPQARLDAAARPFVGRRLDRAQLQRLTDALSALYAGSDIGLYNVHVPAQSFAGGKLAISVEEGFIDAVEVAGDAGGAAALVAAYGRRLTAERPLRRSTFERIAALLRAIPGAAVTLDLKPGPEPGGMRLLVGVRATDHLFGFGLDNRGIPALGAVQLQASADLYGLFGDGG
ncbi:MAG: POTRA domain-containing protein [Rhizomicrobium sp.]